MKLSKKTRNKLKRLIELNKEISELVAHETNGKIIMCEHNKILFIVSPSAKPVSMEEVKEALGELTFKYTYNGAACYSCVDIKAESIILIGEDELCQS